MLQLVEQSFLIAPSATLQGAQTTTTPTTNKRATNSYANGIGDADGAWDTAEGDGLDNYFVHETGGADDLEMDDTEE